MGVLVMSLVNQVLNQLEQRGAQASPNQTLLRAVPMRSERKWVKSAFIMLAAVAMLISGLLLWHKAQPKKSEKLEEVSSVALAPIPVEPPAPAKKKASQPASKMSREIAAGAEAALPRETKMAKAAMPVPKPGTITEQKTRDESAVVTQAESKRVEIKAPENKQAENKAPEYKQAENKQVEIKAPEIKQLVMGNIPSGQAKLKQISSTQQADAEYRKAWEQQQQGHGTDALAGYESALKLNAQHEDARLAMAVLLMEQKRSVEAERLLQEGVKLKPTHAGFSMVLARVQVERGDNEQALATLQVNLPQASGKADYQAFYAALLQRVGRNKDALEHFQIALQIMPNNGIWRMGYGISLQAVERNEEAKVAYQQALATRSLNADLTEFVQQKLKGL